MDEAPALTDEARTSAIGLARYAELYAIAANTIDASVVDDPRYNFISPIPAYFLALHSIELAAKAYLRHNGSSLRFLSKKMGHDVARCIRKARLRGLDDVYRLTAEDESALDLLIALNGVHHELRYQKSGMKTFPSWAIVEPLVVRFVRAVCEHVGWRHRLTSDYAGDDLVPALSSV